MALHFLRFAEGCKIGGCQKVTEEVVFLPEDGVGGVGFRVASPSFPSFHISPLVALKLSLAPLINASANNIFPLEKTNQGTPNEPKDLCGFKNKSCNDINTYTGH